MKRLLLIISALLVVASGAWAYSTVTFTNAQDSKGNALVSGGFYRILLPSRGASVALKQNGDYVQAYNGLGILGYMWKMEADASGYAIVSNPAGGYWKLVDHSEGNSKLKTDGTSTSDCTAFQMAWVSSSSKTLNLFDPTEGSYSYGGVTCGTVLSNHSGVGQNMGIYNDILDGGSIFKFERFYQTVFTISEDVNGVTVENYPGVTINGSTTATEYYTNSDNQISSFATAYAAKYYIGGVEKTAEEVKDAINANTSTLTVVVKPQPFIASTILSPVYYALMISGNANSWWENKDGSVVNCGAGRALPSVTGRSAWIWQLIQNSTDGYRIYSVDAEKYLGGRTTTGGALTLDDAASANSFKAYYNDATTVKFKDYTNILWIDRATVNSVGQPYAHTGGQMITFLPMYKVTFSEGVAVDGGSAVTTIYVKGDGSDSFTLPSDKLYSINGAAAVGYADAATAIAACSSNLTVTVSENTTKEVDYVLKWSDGTTISTVENVTTDLLSPSADYLPSSMASDFVTLSYDPEEIDEETTEVTVTATWNGPFEISSNYASAKWLTVAIHKYYEGNNYIWKYDGSSKVTTKTVDADDYASVNGNNLFAFVGNPYDGFTIYNQAAGSSLKLTRADDQVTEATMGETATLFVPATSKGGTIANGFFCLKPKGGTNYINMQGINTSVGTGQLKGWDDNDDGSTCWVIAPGQYYLDFIDGLNLNAPVGAVNTRTYFQNVANPTAAKSTITSLRATIASNMLSAELSSVNSQLDPIKATDVITLGDGYYRIVNAFPGWASTAPTIYYNSTNSRMDWSVASNASDNVNSIVRIDASTPSIYSPNAQKYMSVINSEVSGALAAEAGTTVFTPLNSAQYNIIVGGGIMHSAGHNSGAGTGSNLTSWEGTANTCSAWYIVKVESVPLTLNDGGDGYYYATMYMPFDVTISSGTTAYTLTVSGNYAIASEVEDNEVPAGTAVLLRGSSSSCTATINTGSAFNGGEPLDDNDLTGTYVDITGDRTTGEYIFGLVDDKVGFYVRKSGKKIGANKGYLLLGSDVSVKGFAIQWDFEDAIKDMDNTQQSNNNSGIYNLAGQRVKNAQKGIYIVNSKKVLVK